MTGPEYNFILAPLYGFSYFKKTMSSSSEDIYLTCVRRKGHPKKHIDVCRKCRWQSSCKPFQAHRQPGLPLTFHSEKKPKAPIVPTETIKVLKKPASPPPPVIPAITLEDAIELLESVKKELTKIRGLCD